MFRNKMENCLDIKIDSSLINDKSYLASYLKTLFHLQDLANLFLESKDSKDVRHAYSSLICELLTPVAAVINR